MFIPFGPTHSLAEIRSLESVLLSRIVVLWICKHSLHHSPWEWRVDITQHNTSIGSRVATIPFSNINISVVRSLVFSLYIKIGCSADLAPKRWQLQIWLIQFWNPLLMQTGHPIVYIRERKGSDTRTKWCVVLCNIYSSFSCGVTEWVFTNS